MQMPYFRRFLGIVLVFLLTSAVVNAQTYPSQTDPYINDFANLLTPQTEPVLRGLLETFKAEHGVDMVVVTINRVGQYNTGDSTIESFATRLFNTWGIGSAATNRGILLLVAVDDRKVRLEVGRGYDSSYDQKAQVVIDEHILPAFRNNDYNGGIENGVRAAIHMVTGEWPAGSPISLVVGRGILSLLAGGGLLGLGAVGVGAWFYMRHRCPECGKSALSIQSQVLVHATEYSSGEREFTRSCANCGFHNVQHITIPIISHSSDSDSSSSSSSSSDSGGSSDGGGASGSW